jgi:SAM-dependent methyltransferase
MYETITFNGVHYPRLQAEGFAAQYAFPFADKIIGKGKTGFDIGCNREEWKYPGALPIDPAMNEYDAYNLPAMKVDYVFSSHCLEHLPDWVGALDKWREALHDDGVLFLYLPHPVQEYWLPHNNRKHLSVLFPDMIAKYLHDRKWKDIFVTGYDLNCSYYVIARK